MTIRTYRARSIHDALDMVRRELGPDASVLHTREVRSGLLGWLGAKEVEVAASATIQVPTRIRKRQQPPAATTADSQPPAPTTPPDDFRSRIRESLKDDADRAHSMVEELSRRADSTAGADSGEGHGVSKRFFEVFTDLIDAEVDEALARELVDGLRNDPDVSRLEDTAALKARIAQTIEDEIQTCGPIQPTSGSPRVVALVGPTGVGKTTTIAKLAANFHLRDDCRVGLITVDTYRIAAVDQLRTYAEIIDLPMEVVSTPREMREAVEKLSHLDLVLMDTAGRSPRDEVRIQELKSMLVEAQPNDVYLVLSSVSSLKSLTKTAERFAAVGVNGLVLTKLDEATGLGNLLPLMRGCGLPVSYLTNGQNVPDDIAPATPPALARSILGLDESR